MYFIFLSKRCLQNDEAAKDIACAQAFWLGRDRAKRGPGAKCA